MEHVFIFSAVYGSNITFSSPRIEKKNNTNHTLRKYENHKSIIVLWFPQVISHFVWIGSETFQPFVSFIYLKHLFHRHFPNSYHFLTQTNTYTCVYWSSNSINFSTVGLKRKIVVEAMCAYIGEVYSQGKYFNSLKIGSNKKSNKFSK